MQLHLHFFFLKHHFKRVLFSFCPSFWKEGWSQNCSPVNTFSFCPHSVRKCGGEEEQKAISATLLGSEQTGGGRGSFCSGLGTTLLVPGVGLRSEEGGCSPQANSLRGTLDSNQVESYFHANHQDSHQSLIHKVSRVGLGEGQGSESR